MVRWRERALKQDRVLPQMHVSLGRVLWWTLQCELRLTNEGNCSEHKWQSNLEEKTNVQSSFRGKISILT
jgi:hypothetical protein